MHYVGTRVICWVTTRSSTKTTETTIKHHVCHGYRSPVIILYAVVMGVLVSALMTKTVITCSPNDNIALVASTMLSRNIRHLPVEEEDRLVGMVSIRDVLNLRLNELQQQTALLRTLVNEVGRAPQDRE